MSRTPYQFEIEDVGCVRVLQCVAVCCSVLQCVAACCSASQCLTNCGNEQSVLSIWNRWSSVGCCSVLRCVAVCCSVSQCVAVRGSVWQCIAVCRNLSQRLTNHTSEQGALSIWNGWSNGRRGCWRRATSPTSIQTMARLFTSSGWTKRCSSYTHTHATYTHIHTRNSHTHIHTRTSHTHIHTQLTHTHTRATHTHCWFVYTHYVHTHTRVLLTHTCTYTHIYLNMYLHTHLHTHVSTHTWIYIHIYFHTHTFTHTYTRPIYIGAFSPLQPPARALHRKGMVNRQGAAPVSLDEIWRGSPQLPVFARYSENSRARAKEQAWGVRRSKVERDWFWKPHYWAAGWHKCVRV